MNLWNDVIRKLAVPLFLALMMAIGYRFTDFTGYDNAVLGIHPLDVRFIWGIITVPFAHGSISHLMGNLTAFIVLTAFLFVIYDKIATSVLAWLWLLTGLLMFLIARPGFVHIGASGVVYALIFYLVTSGVLNRTRTPMVMAIVVAFYYGGSIWGIFPLEEKVSWDGHLSGAAAGIVVSLLSRRKVSELFPKVVHTEWLKKEDEHDDWYEGFDYRK